MNGRTPFVVVRERREATRHPDLERLAAGNIVEVNVAAHRVHDRLQPGEGAHRLVAPCEFACNIDPLRGVFASNSDPL